MTNKLLKAKVVKLESVKLTEKQLSNHIQAKEMSSGFIMRDVSYYDDSDVLEKLCQEYFKLQDIMGAPYGLTGLAEFLGISRGQLINNLMDHHDPDVKQVTRFFLTKIEASKEAELLTGKIGIQEAKFYMTNNHDWRDKLSTDSRIHADITTNAGLSNDQIKENFAELMIEIGVPKDIVDGLDL